MRRMILTASWLSLFAGAGCNKKADGLPPATEWQTEVAAPDEMPGMPPAIGMGHNGGPEAESGDPSDPHAGVDMTGGDPSDPHAGVDMTGGDPSNPHAGVDPSQNPHGAGGGMDVTKLGLQGPDPNRPIDPTHRVSGIISIAPAALAKAKPGTSIFLIVKRAGASGEPIGSALAVDKLDWSAEGVPFELTDGQAMIAGTELSGDVVVTARYDQDADAISKQPGDITGQVRVKIPADHVKLTLDTVLP
jgi:hypothetical protein